MVYDPNVGGPRAKPLEELFCSRYYNPLNGENMLKPTSIEINGDIIPDIKDHLESKNITKKELGL